MGGFLSTLGSVGQQIGQQVGSGMLQNSPIANSVYQSWRKRRTDAQNTPTTQDGKTPQADSLTGDATGYAGRQAMMDANRASGMEDMSKPGAGADASVSGMIPDAATMAASSQWNQSFPFARGGTVVSQPMIAKLGEHGPEAVIPLNARAQNRMQPDMLEGHITAPKVPGVRYSRYRTFNRFGGQGGAG